MRDEKEMEQNTAIVAQNSRISFLLFVGWFFFINVIVKIRLLNQIYFAKRFEGYAKQETIRRAKINVFRIIAFNAGG